LVRIPERQPERPVAAWARGVATRSKSATARIGIIDVERVVAFVVAVASRRRSTRVFPPFELLLELSPHFIVGRIGKLRASMFGLVKWAPGERSWEREGEREGAVDDECFEKKRKKLQALGCSVLQETFLAAPTGVRGLLSRVSSTQTLHVDVWALTGGRWDANQALSCTEDGEKPSDAARPNKAPIEKAKTGLDPRATEAITPLRAQCFPTSRPDTPSPWRARRKKEVKVASQECGGGC
jgi:hypothetical protein